MRRISLLLSITTLLCAAPALAENVYRWTDDQGEVHYGRTLPPEYANKPYEILNSSGVVIERVTDPKARQQPEMNEKKELEPLFTPDEVRLRSDRLLVLRYHSEADIQEAMQLEVDQLGYDRRLINQSMSSAMTSLAAQVRNAADRQRAGMPVEESSESSINDLRRHIRENEDSLAALRQREAGIRATFQKDLERYRYLQNGGVPGSIMETDTGAEGEAAPEDAEQAG